MALSKDHGQVQAKAHILERFCSENHTIYSVYTPLQLCDDRTQIHREVRAMHTIHTEPSRLSRKIIDWQLKHGRHDLPWQQEPTPYRVLVSEIMLQQTQVTTVIPYFERWMAQFPTVNDLAEASEETVMALWQGLGYYSRARNLQKAARYLMEHWHGNFPESLTDLEQIPGVGRYTAGAITSFARDAYGPIVDGNVKRLFCRIFAIEGDPNSSAVSKQLWQLAETYTPQQQNRTYAQGLLDMGATVCKPKLPRCAECPLQSDCQAFQQDRITELPTPKLKKETPVRAGYFLWTIAQGRLLLEKRPSPGIWGGLWCLPQIEEKPLTASMHGKFRHVFTHYKLNASVWTAETGCPSSIPDYQRWVSHNELADIGLPTPIRSYIEKHWETDLN